MGLFDFLKRKPAASSDGDGPSPEYAFAHYALRQLALAKPVHFLALMASPKAQPFFKDVLADVSEQCGRKCSFDAAAVQVHHGRIAEYPCAVIVLPEPKNMAEAYMVAVVALIDPSQDEPDIENVKGRYFTLERGLSLAGGTRTVLCEWSETGHSNYGDGPPATVEAFVSALREHVDN